MSNWVYNYIKVFGKDEDLKKFKEDVALNNETVFSFNKIIPMPEDTSSWDASGTFGSRNWGLEHWGTGYDCGFSELSEEQNYLAYEFTTLWTGPQLIYETIIDKYKNLTFEIDYFESTNCWAIEISGSSGEVTGSSFNKDYRYDFQNSISNEVHSEIDIDNSRNDSIGIQCYHLDDDDLLAALDNMS